MAKKPKNLDDISTAVGTVVPERKRIRKTLGKETRKGFQEFVVDLLRWNEQAGRHHNDAKLKSMIMAEFAHSSETLRSFQDGCTSVAKLRNEYNRGVYKAFLDDNRQNPQISCKYGPNGEVLDTSKPTVVATNGCLRDYYDKYKPAESWEQFMARLGRKKSAWNDPEAVE